MRGKLVVLILFVLALSFVSTGRVHAELVGWWKLDESSGTVAKDSSGHDHHGTLHGDPEWVSGFIGGAIRLDGDGDYVDIGSVGISRAAPRTVAGWVKADTTAIPGWTTVFGFAGDANDNTPRWDIEVDSEGNYALHMGPPRTFPLLPVDTEWHHFAVTSDGNYGYSYLDGESLGGGPGLTMIRTVDEVRIGARLSNGNCFPGIVDDVRVYDRALTLEEVKEIMVNVSPKAFDFKPEDGAQILSSFVSLSWQAGYHAVSHDVYVGDNFDDVNEAARDSEVFRINTNLTFYVAGYVGYAYPEGLVPGTTYYWRIDEVNDTDPNNPCKGDVWSFSFPSNNAYSPVPADGAEFVPENATLTWTPGMGAKLHTVYFGEDYDTVNNATDGVTIGVARYTPDSLELAKTYYWRVDEDDGDGAICKGDVWSFTTEGAVNSPNPVNGAVDVSPTQSVTWDAGAVAASHEVYFGTDADAIKNATKTSPEYKGPKALGEESYDPGKLLLETTYYWRIDEVNGINPDSPWTGNIWNFTTGDFFVIDDFEDYDSSDNKIWCSWYDGLGYGIPGTEDYFGGNRTGAAVGTETTPSFVEETIVHGGNQSMPISYDNNKQDYSKYSEVELTLTALRDWTREGVTELSLWFRGYPASVGSFVEDSVGTFTMTASGTQIFGDTEEFHYAYKTLSGIGSIVARVDSVENTNPWAKAGVMIRETLNVGSRFAFIAIAPGKFVNSQYRRETYGDNSGTGTTQSGITTPHWVKLERDISGYFTMSHSADGVTWQPVADAAPQYISMDSNVYIGLALTASNAALTCEALFSNITTIGEVSPQWAHQDIGITSNAAEPLYVAVSNSAGTPAVVVYDNPAATTIDTWTEWVIPLQAFADQGVILNDVDWIAIGLGTRGNITIPGGSGKIYLDDIRLYRPKFDP